MLFDYLVKWYVFIITRCSLFAWLMAHHYHGPHTLDTIRGHKPINANEKMTSFVSPFCRITFSPSFPTTLNEQSDANSISTPKKGNSGCLPKHFYDEMPITVADKHKGAEYTLPWHCPVIVSTFPSRSCFVEKEESSNSSNKSPEETAKRLPEAWLSGNGINIKAIDFNAILCTSIECSDFFPGHANCSLRRVILLFPCCRRIENRHKEKRKHCKRNEKLVFAKQEKREEWWTSNRRKNFWCKQFIFLFRCKLKTEHYYSMNDEWKIFLILSSSSSSSLSMAIVRRATIDRHRLRPSHSFRIFVWWMRIEPAIFNSKTLGISRATEFTKFVPTILRRIFSRPSVSPSHSLLHCVSIPLPYPNTPFNLLRFEKCVILLYRRSIRVSVCGSHRAFFIEGQRKEIASYYSVGYRYRRVLVALSEHI